VAIRSDFDGTHIGLERVWPFLMSMETLDLKPCVMFEMSGRRRIPAYCRDRKVDYLLVEIQEPAPQLGHAYEGERQQRRRAAGKIQINV
jgi:hypothetical protein